MTGAFRILRSHPIIFLPYKKFELSSKRKGIIAENQIFGIDSGWVGNKKWNHFAPGDATRQKA